MTEPRASGSHRFLRPGVFFPFLLGIIILSVLLTPRAATEDAGSLTTHSTSVGGASGVSEVAERFGWRVQRLEAPFTPTMSSDAIYAVLVPGYRLTTSETHLLLDRVRAGASLLILLGRGALRDSMHLDVGERQGPLVRGRDSVSCPQLPRTIRTLQARIPFLASDVERTAPLVGDTVHLALMGGERWRQARPTILGVKLGRGRIAAVAEGSMLTNEVMRTCRWGAGIAVVRALEWLSEREGGPPRRVIVFDEFHHGYGTHASVLRTMRHWGLQTPSGRTTLQIIIAGLVLLLAAAARPIAPVPFRTIARRSPLEHVTALAQAYEKVRGTRIGTRLLVKGVRRRANRPVGTHTASEETFLDSVATRMPSLNTDVSRVKSAMTHEVPPAEFLGIASLIDRIERSVRS
jgi:hypothetical protein